MCIRTAVDEPDRTRFQYRRGKRLLLSARGVYRSSFGYRYGPERPTELDKGQGRTDASLRGTGSGQPSLVPGPRYPLLSKRALLPTNDGNNITYTFVANSGQYKSSSRPALFENVKRPIGIRGAAFVIHSVTFRRIDFRN